MAVLYHEYGVRIFNFHDDNFFLRSESANLDRFAALKSALGKEAVGHIAVQIKARPDSISRKVVDCLKELGLFRVFLGVESNAVAGLRTLRRGIRREQNREALHILETAGIHTTFNLLMFDPETTVQDMNDNLDFLEANARFPVNFGRVEVYTGTPLERRLRGEDRLRGDYFGFSYEIRNPEVERAFRMFKQVFTPRNFDDGGMNLVGMKLDYLLHLLAHFYPHRVTADLRRQCKSEIEELNRNSVELLKMIQKFTIETELSDSRSEVLLADELVVERDVFDQESRRRMTRLMNRIEQLGNVGCQWRFPARAAAAAAAIVISTSGCRNTDRDSHPHEMIMRPIEKQQGTNAPKKAPGEPASTRVATNAPPSTKKPDDWHMCEMMMRPIEERGKDGTATVAE